MNRNFTNENLTEASFPNHMMNCVFTDSVIRNVNMTKKEFMNITFSCNIDNTNFSGARLMNIKFGKSFVDNVNFSDANLMNIDFGESEFENVTFEKTKFRNAKFELSSFNNVNFYDCEFINCDLTEVVFINVNMKNAKFDNCLVSLSVTQATDSPEESTH
jgi:uncharacterized protein YjbI with pentapeptide repeats